MKEGHEGGQADMAPKLTCTDHRNGKTFTVPLRDDGAVQGVYFFKEAGLRLFDPGARYTAICKSGVSCIDREGGKLRYRGYDIAELVEKSTFLDVAFLLIEGELPTKDQSAEWRAGIMKHTFVHENLTALLKSFRYDAHPMGMMVSALAAASTFHPDANPALQGTDLYADRRVRNKQMFRILGKLPTIAAMCYRHRIGRAYNHPDTSRPMSYTENFLFMLDRLSEVNYTPNKELARILDKLFILHAEHELNCATAAMRHLSSSRVDPYTAISGAATALYGQQHGGACGAVLDMLQAIGGVDGVPAFISRVVNKEERLQGFGHWVYKAYDPRATILKALCRDVFALFGKKHALFDVAEALETAALSHEFFTSRNLFPNVDYYAAIIYSSMGFPRDYFSVLFTVPRAVGWLAHWSESLDDRDTKIWRPRQIYKGAAKRDYVPVEKRPASTTSPLEYSMSAMSTRRMLSEKEGEEKKKE